MKKVNTRDVEYLKGALALAKKARGRTFPNPMVGAVIVKNGRIIGRGYHREVGAPHAEINALKAAAGGARGATLYLNLEPCSHWGKTPPCVEAIIRAKIKRVVCCMRDPNPQVSGAGIQQLRRANIEVSIGGCSAEAEALNESFLFFHRNRRPFVAIKFAASLDGKIATRTGDSKWITNERALAYARALRSEYQAILVGINTVLRDDPHHGVRIKGRPDPLRIILGSTLKIPLKSKVLRDTNVLIFTTKRADKAKYEKLTAAGIKVVTCAGASVPASAVLKELIRRGIISVLVEGGGATLGSFVDAGSVDKAYVFQSPVIIGGEKAKSAIGGRGVDSVSNALRLTRVTHKTFGDNTLTSGYPKKSEGL